ncbi:PRELI domain containing protein 3B-like [Mya arenaria]|uniref:PRELI domain containing protein 3B-like n=1 Tax=Mya arenaria TaxID=6604 RepID=UPI0022E7C3C9|nr:PRELI domain containing protein 3B-like [Mya arenaria]
MKIRTAEHIFDEPWELVVRAQFRKYPNKLNQAVEGIDVVDRTVDQAGVLRSHRLLTTRWGLPGWATKIIGSDGLGYGSEHSEVNPQAKSMEMKTRNVLNIFLCFKLFHSSLFCDRDIGGSGHMFFQSS